MQRDASDLRDRAAIERALRASWPGVWVQPQGSGGEQTPLDWAAGFGRQHPERQADVAQALAALVLDGDDGLAFAALDVLFNTGWDPVPHLFDFIEARLDELADRPSPRRKDASALGEMVTLMQRSPARAALPDGLADALAAVRGREDGFPATQMLAAGHAPERHLAAWVGTLSGAHAGALPTLVEALLAWGPPLLDNSLDFLGKSGGAEQRQRVGEQIKAVLDEAAQRVEEGIGNTALPKEVRDRYKAVRGSHAKRWQDAARRLRLED